MFGYAYDYDASFEDMNNNNNNNNIIIEQLYSY